MNEKTAKSKNVRTRSVVLSFGSIVAIMVVCVATITYLGSQRTQASILVSPKGSPLVVANGTFNLSLPIKVATPTNVTSTSTNVVALPLEAKAAVIPVSPNIETKAQILALVQQNFPANQVSNAMAVADCESEQESIKGTTNFDGTTDWGVFQLNDGGTLQSGLARIGILGKTKNEATALAMDAAINIKIAASIYADRGWSPWVCAYKQQIVAHLYTNIPGHLNGQYTLTGTSLLPTKPKAPVVNKPSHKPTPTPVPTPVVKPTPTPTPTITPTPTPTVTPTPTTSSPPISTPE